VTDGTMTLEIGERVVAKADRALSNVRAIASGAHCLTAAPEAVDQGRRRGVRPVHRHLFRVGVH
jgi:hypothetical protein